MSIQEIVDQGRTKPTLRGRFSRMMDKISGNGAELLGSLKGQIAIRKMMEADEDETKNMIRNVLLEFGGISIDSYYFDDSLEYLYETFNTKGARVLVAVKNGEVIGSVAVRQLTCEGGNPIDGVCELNQFYVKSKHRGEGLGCRLLEKVLSEARQLGYHSCHVSTNVVFRGLDAILRHCGFEVSDLKVKKCGEQFSGNQFLKTL